MVLVYYEIFSISLIYSIYVFCSADEVYVSYEVLLIYSSATKCILHLLDLSGLLDSRDLPDLLDLGTCLLAGPALSHPSYPPFYAPTAMNPPF